MTPYIDFLFVIYFDLIIQEKISYKCFINAPSKERAIEFFKKKSSKDMKGFHICNIHCFKIIKNSYKGKRIADKHWEHLQNLSYPNTKHKMKKFHKSSWFKPIFYKNRDKKGRFKEGNTPWNKGLKISIQLRSDKGFFIKSRNK